ncbi:signal peptidase II [Candidatus Pelagibacter sp. HIMB1695]|uniref:signal peptidase II n=1 Tax=Candidatus Pelagibacter sp. HIMB1695 TaxID=3413364 RepID=UPI003F8387EA
MLKNFFKNHFFELIVLSFIFLSDRFSKIYIIYLDKISKTSEIYMSKFLNIHLIWNEGIAFGLFSFQKSNLYNFLTFIIIIVILIIIFMTFRSKGLKKYSFLMILGGAIGNVFDRIIYNAVPDFIDFHIGEFHWFIFNVADVFISLGIIFMIFLELIDNNDTSRVKKI